MLTVNASTLADEYVKLIIQSHPQQLSYSYPLQTEDTARQLAQSIAALRQELIALLTQQQ